VLAFEQLTEVDGLIEVGNELCAGAAMAAKDISTVPAGSRPALP
jgi:hypothetical protein